MIDKVKIAAKLGERAVLIPGLIAAGLASNDRIKLRLTALQLAASRARDGDRADSAQASQLGDARLEKLVAGARSLGANGFTAPGAAELAAGAAQDVLAMLAPIEAAEPDSALKARTNEVLRRLPAFPEDRVAYAEIAAMTSVAREDAGLHPLVMDLHKEINRLAAVYATERIDGASAYGLDERGRARLRAFMTGLKRTAELAFGHPGLGTTAAQNGNRVTIQNDIGTTDAHVLILHVEDDKARWTYTDVHRLRAKFFMGMFAAEKVEWGAIAERLEADLAEGEAFHVVAGEYRASDVADLDRFLAFFASRIVFLIDWNKARKALRVFVSKEAAVRLLEDAARRDVGHRAFLDLGGETLIFEAIRRDARVPYGASLAETLGDRETEAFLRSALALATEGLRDGRSARLICDEVQADLAARLDSAERELMQVLLRHLGLTRTLAGMIEGAIESMRLAGPEQRRSVAARAKQMERKADALTLEARQILAKASRADALRVVVDEIENATDAFDEAAFLLSLVDDAPAAAAQLLRLATVAREAVAWLVRGVEAALHLHEGRRIDSNFALQCVDAVIDAERQGDVAERVAIAAMMQDAQAESGEQEAAKTLASEARREARRLMLGMEITRALEAATDRLAHAAIALRDCVLEELAA